ncbi:MAG: hypothetical protein H7837_05615 [Magnetococcus sp. MYC-9]
MLSLHAQALINSFAWPLLDYQALVSGWGDGWQACHDAFMQNRFPQLGRDEIVQIRCLAWPPDAQEPPTPQEAVCRLAELFTEVRGGKVWLKSSPHLPHACTHYPPSNREQWIPPEGIASSWLYAARLVQPAMIAAYWCQRCDLPPTPHHNRPAIGDVEADFSLLDSLWQEGVGDYHVHQSAAIDQKHFFPLLPFHPDSWNGAADASAQDRPFKKQWTPLDRGVFADATHINFMLLMLVHGGVAWMLRAGEQRLPQSYCQPLHDLLLEVQPHDLGTEEQAKRRILTVLKDLSTLPGQPVSPPNPENRDAWVDTARLSEIWRNLPPIPEDGHLFWFNHLLWLRNLIFRLVAQPPGTPGFANFKVWFARAEYGNTMLRYMRPHAASPGSRNPLQEQCEAITAGGRVQRVEFRASFDDNDKIRCTVRDYLNRNRKSRVGITFSQQLAKEEDVDQPSGICALDDPAIKDNRKSDSPRYVTLIRQYVNSVFNTVQFAMRHPEILLLIRGLDVVNHERRTPNWVPGLVYHFYNEQIEKAYRNGCRKQSWRPPPYRHTFHAGEDFWLPADGLRAVFEPIHFQILRRGDRIGHGLVLGLDLDRWAARSESRVTRFGVHLDDLVWEWSLLRRGSIEGNLAIVEEEIARTLEQIRGRDLDNRVKGTVTLQSGLDIGVRWQAYERRFDYAQLKKWGLVGGMASDSWFRQDKVNELDKTADEEVDRLYCEYLSKRSLWRALEEGCMVQVDERRIRRWQALQSFVIRLVAAGGITVEACPTSNVLISGINAYAEHPIFRLAPLDGSGRLQVSLNTDDPITFSQTVCLEYQHLYQAALDQGIPGERALRWLEHVGKMGWNASFLPSPLDYPDRDKRLRTILSS